MIERDAGGADDDTLLPIEGEEWETVSLLRAERPVPAPAFRGALGGHLALFPQPAGTGGRRAPVRPLLAAAYLGGTVLLGAAALGLAGLGPFAA